MLFQLIQTFIFLPFQRLCTFSFMFSWRNCSAFELFPLLSCFSPLTFQLHCLNMHTLFHRSGRKQPNYKWNNFLNGKCCLNKYRCQHATTAARPDSNMPRHAWTARARSSLLAALISKCSMRLLVYAIIPAPA